jgi:predicted neutral ceramidase superfamily lipid hydrolase
MLASSFCLFVVGCYIAEIFKTKISRKGLKYIAILAVLFALHIFIDDGITSWRYAPPLSILWYPWSYVELTGQNPFFLCLGLIVNHCSYVIPYRPYPFRTYGPIKQDIFIAVLSLFAFVTLMYGTCVPAIFEGMSVQTAWIVRYVVRVVCFAPWIMLMVSLYRVLTSNWVYKVTAKVPKIISFLAYLAPIAIWRIWSIHFPVYGLYELLSFLILVVSFAIYIRLAFRLIRSLVKRISGKREMSQGDVTQTFNNIPSDEA